MPIQTKLRALQEQISSAAQRAGRNPQEIELLLVSKTHSTDKILEAHRAGQVLFGENKAQELSSKAEALKDTPLKWHFIGHLQSNKIKDILPYTALLHSLDRLSLAQKLNRKLQELGQTLPVLIQVNTSFEDQKSGVLPAKALELIEKVAAMKHLQVQGLMTIGLFSDNEHKVRDCFKRLKEVQAQVQAKNWPSVKMDTLSMGMSGDFEWAIEEGSTLIRVGSAVFGERN